MLKQVIDLFYNGQIMIGAEVKPHIVKALQMLKVTNVAIQNLAQQQPTAPSANGKHLLDCQIHFSLFETIGNWYHRRRFIQILSSGPEFDADTDEFRIRKTKATIIDEARAQS